MRLRAKIDTNQPKIVSALRALGATVQSLATVGHGVPDLLVGHCGENFLLEVKTETGKLTPDETIWIAKWNGHVTIVRTAEEALAAIRLPFQ